MRALLVALLVLLAAPAAEARTLGRIDRSHGIVVSDGQALVAWPAPDATVRVLDTASGVYRVLPFPEGCDLTALGAGQLLFSCRNREPHGGGGIFIDVPRLVDVRTGAMEEPLSYDQVVESYPEYVSWTAVGKYWLAAAVGGYHWDSTGYWPRVGTARVAAPRSPRVIADLDRPGLVAPLCAPLERSPNEDDNTYHSAPPFIAEFTYARPWALYDGASVAVQRCGERRPRVLCRRACSVSRRLASGRVAWIGGDRLRVRVLRGGRTTTWRLRHPRRAVVAALTRHAVVTQHTSELVVRIF